MHEKGLSSVGKRKEAEENQACEKKNSKKETPVAWKKNKTHKYKRKQERF